MANEIEIVVKAKDQTSAGFSSVTKSSKEAADSLDRVGESADAVDTRAMGFRDTLTGVQDTMKGTSEIAKGNLFEGFLTLGAGIGDLGSGIYNFLVPALKNLSIEQIKNVAVQTQQKAATLASAAAQKVVAAATWAWTIAQRALNLAMRMSPIGIAITLLAALAAAIVIAYKRSETFRNIVQAAGRMAVTAFRSVLSAVSSVINWIRGNWPKLLLILTGPIGVAIVVIRRYGAQIRAVFAGIPGAVYNAFNRVKGAIVNAVASGVQAALGILERIPSYVAGIPGRVAGSLSSLGSQIAGAINPFAHGGVVGAAGGGPRGNVTLVGEQGPELVRLPAGSSVIPAGRTGQLLSGGGGAAVVIEIRSGGSRMDDLLVDIIKKAVRVRGGDVQAALGQGY